MNFNHQYMVQMHAQIIYSSKNSLKRLAQGFLIKKLKPKYSSNYIWCKAAKNYRCKKLFDDPYK